MDIAAALTAHVCPLVPAVSLPLVSWLTVRGSVGEGTWHRLWSENWFISRLCCLPAGSLEGFLNRSEHRFPCVVGCCEGKRCGVGKQLCLLYVMSLEMVTADGSWCGCPAERKDKWTSLALPNSHSPVWSLEFRLRPLSHSHFFQTPLFSCPPPDCRKCFACWFKP